MTPIDVLSALMGLRVVGEVMELLLSIERGVGDGCGSPTSAKRVRRYARPPSRPPTQRQSRLRRRKARRWPSVAQPSPNPGGRAHCVATVRIGDRSADDGEGRLARSTPRRAAP
eukprot:89639-Pleurochrysis_carterae.AAC.1